MAIIGDAGGGTTTSVCQVSPGDEKAILGNIIERVANIETFLSKLVAADVYANNLAELARDMGNLVNGSIMMPADPNSPIGPGYGSIPVPEGYTGQVINGNQVTTWQNGVVSFSVLPGTGVTTGATNIRNYLVLTPTTTVLTSLQPQMTTLYSRGTEITFSAPCTIELNSAGLYQINMNFVTQTSSGSGTSAMECTVYETGSLDQVLHVEDWRWRDGSENAGFVLSFLVPVSIASAFGVTFVGVSNLGNTTDSHISVAKLA